MNKSARAVAVSERGIYSAPAVGGLKVRVPVGLTEQSVELTTECRERLLWSVFSLSPRRTAAQGEGIRGAV